MRKHLDPFQSGFRPACGTLVALVDDLWQEWDGAGVSNLALLDLWVVFDTILHGILLDLLRELVVSSTVLC